MNIAVIGILEWVRA